MKKRTLFIVALLVLLLGSTMGAYAYWDNLQKTETGSVTIGEGDTIVVSETLAGSGILIPVGETPSAGEVTSITFTYSVSVNAGAVASGKTTLAVSESNITNDTNGLVQFAYSGVGELSTTPTTVTVTITLTAPADVTEYNAIINKVIGFDLSFSVS